MTWEVFGAFVVTSLILAVAPDPDNLFVLVQSAVYGARSGLAAVAGLVTGAALQTVAAAAGVAAVVAASDVLFWGIRILGALYLLYLAWGAWHAPHDAGIARGVALSYGALYRRGIVMNITNPKVQIFFLAFFPQFVTNGAGAYQTALEMVILGIAFIACTLIVFSAVAVTAGSLADRLRTPAVQYWLNKTAAVIFTVLAACTLLLE